MKFREENMKISFQLFYYNIYEWVKRTKFLFAGIYWSPRRYSNSSETLRKISEKNEIHFYDNFMTNWLI